MHFKVLTEQVPGKVLQMPFPDKPVRFIMTDSRKALLGPDAIFFAISGVHHDGHTYIEELYHKGCRQFVVEKKPSVPLKQANIFLVKDTVDALQKMAGLQRKRYSLPVMGVTGSNGKTIVKEWLSQLLSQKWQVVKSPRSYNSQIGVPLSVWQINEQHQLGVFEAGISRVGEMAKLQSIIMPTFGIFTNIGPAHAEGFQSLSQKAEEKALLFKDCRSIVYRKDYPEVDEALTSRLEKGKLASWSTKQAEGARWGVSYSVNDLNEAAVTITRASTQKAYHFIFHYVDEASLENVTHCIIFLLEQDWSIGYIQAGLHRLRRINMRMVLKRGVNGCYLLDDSYSNDLAGLEIALNHLLYLPRNQKNTVILSDLLETSWSHNKLYKTLSALLEAFPIQRLVLIGSDSHAYREYFERKSWKFEHYLTTESMLAEIQTATFKQENILIKGARVFAFEKIVHCLQQQFHTTRLEINLDAIVHNLNMYRSFLKRETRLMVMVKAFSYGGAAFEIANLLQYHQVDYLAVAYADEGVMLRQHGIRIPILVLNPSPNSYELMAEYQLEPEIYSLAMLEDWARLSHNELPIHIKLDTGMHRLGFMHNEITPLCDFLKEQPQVKVKSVFTHLVASEDPVEDKFSRQQIHQYQFMYDQLVAAIGYSPMRHALNSAGILRFPKYQMDMVRLGLGLYGVDITENVSDLQPISQLKTTISQIKHLEAGESIGYNRAGKVVKPKTIATLAIGYADGLDRRLGNGKLKVWIHGKPAPTIGNICMDMTMVDVSRLDARVGDEVVIFGKEQHVKVLAEAMGTIPYEVLTGISERVKRVFFADT